MSEEMHVPPFDPCRVRTEDILAALRQVGQDLLIGPDPDGNHCLRGAALFEAADRMEAMLVAGANMTRAFCWANVRHAGVEGPPDKMEPGVIAEWFRVNGRQLPEHFGLTVVEWNKG